MTYTRNNKARLIDDCLAHDECAGGVVVLRATNGVQLLLIADRYGNWTLPKGHLEPGETPAMAAVREIAEETGVDGAIVGVLGKVSYPICRGGQRYEKLVHYFLVEATCPNLVPQRSEITAAAWFCPADALSANFYANNRSIIERAIRLLETEP